MLRLTFSNGDTTDVTFNHESVVAITNMTELEAGVFAEKRLEWTDVVGIEQIDAFDNVPNVSAAVVADPPEQPESSGSNPEPVYDDPDVHSAIQANLAAQESSPEPGLPAEPPAVKPKRTRKAKDA